MVGQIPTAEVKKINGDLELAKWHEKMSSYCIENYQRKYARTAEKLRELDHLRKYAKHYDSCMAIRIDNDKCTCGLNK